MVFFDSLHVYSTSKTTIPEGNSINGPVFFNEKLEWFKEKHNGSIILPSGDKVPVGLMSFAAPVKENNHNEHFFVILIWLRTLISFFINRLVWCY